MTGMNWPPLIVATQEPRWIRWRDSLLTLAMWILFALMLNAEFELAFGHYFERWGLGDFDTDPNWPEYVERLRPFARVGIVLIATLAVASIATLLRRRRTLLLSPPPPLDIGDEARRVGMTEADLAAAREQRLVVVHIDNDGSHRIKQR